MFAASFSVVDLFVAAHRFAVVPLVAEIEQLMCDSIDVEVVLESRCIIHLFKPVYECIMRLPG